MLSSLICTVGGVGDPVGGGDCWDGGAEQVSQVQSLFLRYWAAFCVLSGRSHSFASNGYEFRHCTRVALIESPRPVATRPYCEGGQYLTSNVSR